MSDPETVCSDLPQLVAEVLANDEHEGKQSDAMFEIFDIAHNYSPRFLLKVDTPLPPCEAGKLRTAETDSNRPHLIRGNQRAKVLDVAEKKI